MDLVSFNYHWFNLKWRNLSLILNWIIQPSFKLNTPSPFFGKLEILCLVMVQKCIFLPSPEAAKFPPWEKFLNSKLFISIRFLEIKNFRDNLTKRKKMSDLFCLYSVHTSLNVNAQYIWAITHLRLKIYCFTKLLKRFLFILCFIKLNILEYKQWLFNDKLIYITCLTQLIIWF